MAAHCGARATFAPNVCANPKRIPDTCRLCYTKETSLLDLARRSAGSFFGKMLQQFYRSPAIELPHTVERQRLRRLCGLKPLSLANGAFLMRLFVPATAIALCAVFSAPAHADDLLFDLTNSSTADLHELYVSASDTDAWGEDILGQDVLAVDEAANVTIPDGTDTCAFDLRFVMDNGNIIEGSADLCTTNSFTITD